MHYLAYILEAIALALLVVSMAITTRTLYRRMHLGLVWDTCLTCRYNGHTPFPRQFVKPMWIGFWVGMIGWAGLSIALGVVLVPIIWALRLYILGTIIGSVLVICLSRLAWIMLKERRNKQANAYTEHAMAHASWQSQCQNLWNYTGNDPKGRQHSFGWLQSFEIGHGLYGLYYQYRHQNGTNSDRMVVVNNEGQMFGDQQWIVDTVRQIAADDKLDLPESFDRLEITDRRKPWRVWEGGDENTGTVFRHVPGDYNLLGYFTLPNGALIGVSVKIDCYNDDLDRICISAYWQGCMTSHVLTPIELAGAAAGEAFLSGLRHGKRGMPPRGGMWDQVEARVAP